MCPLNTLSVFENHTEMGINGYKKLYVLAGLHASEMNNI